MSLKQHHETQASIARLKGDHISAGHHDSMAILEGKKSPEDTGPIAALIVVLFFLLAPYFFIAWKMPWRLYLAANLESTSLFWALAALFPICLFGALLMGRKRSLFNNYVLFSIPFVAAYGFFLTTQYGLIPIWDGTFLGNSRLGLHRNSLSGSGIYKHTFEAVFWKDQALAFLICSIGIFAPFRIAHSYLVSRKEKSTFTLLPSRNGRAILLCTAYVVVLHFSFYLVSRVIVPTGQILV